MSVAKKQPTKKDKKKSPKVSENKKIAKKTDKSISSKKQSVIKNKKYLKKNYHLQSHLLKIVVRKNHHLN